MPRGIKHILLMAALVVVAWAVVIAHMIGWINEH